MKDKNTITNETQQNNSKQKPHENQNGKPNLFDKTIKGLEIANQSADTGLRVFSALSDHSAQKDAQFVAEYKSPITPQRRAIIMNAVESKEITRMQGYQELSAIQKQEEAETLQLLNARCKMKKASGDKGLKIGFGICTGGCGLSIIIWTLCKIFGKKTAA